MSQAAGGSAAEDFCYRHPDRRSYVLCQRCGRTICPECQTAAAVGVHCPECVREARASMPRVKRRPVWGRASGGRPTATIALVIANVVVFAIGLLLSFARIDLNSALLFYPPATLGQPWRVVTSLFAHGGFLHIIFNMYALYLFGSQLEQLLGRGRFLALYGIAGLGGVAMSAALSPNAAVVGASGAVFGLFAAFFVIQRHLGNNATQLLIIIGLNFAIGFFVGGVSWQSHLGGAIVGAAIALVYTATRNRRQRGVQLAALVGIGVVCAAAVAFFSATAVSRILGG